MVRFRLLRALILLNALLLASVGLAGVTTAAMAGNRSKLAAPDYSRASAWAATPARPGEAAAQPAGVAAGTKGPVAVFFIHPTTDLSLSIGNAPYDAGGSIGRRVDDAVMKYQASAFNGCCAIYAPRYRQASLGAITKNTPDAYAAANLAYDDVAQAFDAFLDRIGSRPFIIASHSQGSIHALRLLQERIIGTPLQKRLVVAYPIGLALPKQISERGLPICDTATATGCVLSWNSVGERTRDRRRKQDAVIWWQGRYQPIAGRPIVCVNPLDWRPDSAGKASQDLGSVYSVGRGKPIPAPIVGAVAAQCRGGLLHIDIAPRARRHFRDVLSIFGIYHDFDYGLFYMNIRQNVATRIRSYEEHHGR